MENITLGKLFSHLKNLERDVQEIKNHMVDIDMVLTPGEKEEYLKSLGEYAQGKTKALEQAKKELGL